MINISENNLFIRILESAPHMKYKVKYTDDGDVVVYKKPKKEWKDYTIMKGGITINGYMHRFYMSLEYWSAKDYIQQWDQGLSRLEIYNQSCLVESVVHSKKLYAVQWWTLYKVAGEIRMQFHISCESPYREAIKNGLFTPETCYDFIPPYETHNDEGEEITEWVVGYY